MQRRRSLARRAIGAIRETWAEYDYAQRRLLEINVGVPVRPQRRSARPASVAELEALYALEDSRLSK